MESEETLNSQNNLEKVSRVGGFTLCDFKTYYKVTVIKKCVTDIKTDSIYINGWNRLENPKKKPLHIWSNDL